MLSEEYRNNPRLSQSKLKHILYGTQEFEYNLTHQTPSTDPQNLGTAVHLLLLQPHLSDEILKMQKPKARTKTGEALKGGAQLIVDSIKSNPDCQSLLDQCTAFEKIYLYEHKDIKFKCQLDAVSPNFILDLKTTSTFPDEKSIRSQIYANLYHFQAASYLLGANMFDKDYYIIFVRTKPPYTVFPVQLSPLIIQQGFELFEKACDLYHHRHENLHNKIKVI